MTGAHRCSVDHAQHKEWLSLCGNHIWPTTNTILNSGKREKKYPSLLHLYLIWAGTRH